MFANFLSAHRCCRHPSLPSTPVLCYMFGNALPAFIIVDSVTYILTFVYLLSLTRSKDEFLLLSPLHLLYILAHDKCSISKLFHVSFVR
jgi:hypothetical protein